MHMMMGGAGVLALAFLIALIVVGPVVWRSLPAILAAIAAGTAAGFAAALAAESKGCHRARSRSRSHPRSRGRPQTQGRPPSSLTCPYCGGEITAELAVCPTCFRDLKRNCPSCGAVVAVWEARCPRCGEALPPVDPLPSGTGTQFHPELKT